MALHVCDAFLLRLVHILIWLRLFLWTSVTRCLQKITVIFWNLTENRHKQLLRTCKNDSKLLQKVPLHIALQIYENDFSERDASNILVWCMAMGISYVTLCDFEGYCKKNFSSFTQTLQKRVAEVCSGSDGLLSFQINCHRNGEKLLESPGLKSAGVNNSTKIALLSSQDGRVDIIDSARRICEDIRDKRLGLEDIDVPCLDKCINELNDYPDPDLIVQFGTTESLLGFSPWKVRVTEIMTLPSHHNVDYFSFLSILQTFSKTQQRYGK